MSKLAQFKSAAESSITIDGNYILVGARPVAQLVSDAPKQNQARFMNTVRNDMVSIMAKRLYKGQDEGEAAESALNYILGKATYKQIEKVA